MTHLATMQALQLLGMAAHMQCFRKWLGTGLLSAALVAGGAAQAQGATSELSVASALPVAVSVAAPSVLLTGAAAFTLVAVEASARGTVWVLERSSDGVRTSVHFAGDVVRGSALIVGSAVVATAVSAGWVLHSGGKALCIVPNALGRSLMHHERLSR
jgi:hypothetical protein